MTFVKSQSKDYAQVILYGFIAFILLFFCLTQENIWHQEFTNLYLPSFKLSGVSLNSYMLGVSGFLSLVFLSAYNKKFGIFFCLAASILFHWMALGIYYAAPLVLVTLFVLSFEHNSYLKKRHWALLGALFFFFYSRLENEIPTPTRGLLRVYFLTLLVHFYSIYQEQKKRKGKILFQKKLIYCLGLPVNFSSIIYSCEDFWNTYKREPVLKNFKTGFKLFIFGALNSIFVTKIFFNAIPFLNISIPNLSSAYMLGAIKHLSIPEVVLLAFILIIVFTWQMLGVFQIIQGISHLFQFSVAPQMSKIWASNSILDYWKRESRNTRSYMLEYVFFPAYARTRNIYYANLSVWLSYSIFSALAWGALSASYKTSERLIITASMFGKYFIVFGLLSSLEIFLKNKDRKKSMLLKIFLYLILVFALIAARELRVSPVKFF